MTPSIKAESPPSLFVAESTNFFFASVNGELLRKRPYNQCDTVSKLFGQAKAARIREGGPDTDQHTLSARMNEDDEDFVVFQGDEEDFTSLDDAIKGHSCWAVKRKAATCRGDIRVV